MEILRRLLLTLFCGFLVAQMGWQLVRALRTGKAQHSGVSHYFARSAQPIKYWAAVIAFLAFGAFGVLVFVAYWTLPQPAS